MRRLITPAAAVLTLLLLSGSQARATMIDPSTAQWSYNFTPGTVVPAGTPGATQVSPGVWVNQVNAIAADAPGTGGVSFTNEPARDVTGSSDVVATNLRVFSSALPTSPDTFNSGGAYSLVLVVTDKASGDSAVLTFTGNSTQDVVLGNFDYKVSFPTAVYAPPGPPAASNAGSISAHVAVSPSNIGPATVPEPATMVLSGLGLALMGAAGWRKRRQAVAA